MRLKRPEPLRGTPEQQIEQLRRYMFMLIDELEIALDEVKRKEKQLEMKIKEADKG